MSVQMNQPNNPCYWDNYHCCELAHGSLSLCKRHRKALHRLVKQRTREWKRLPWYLDLDKKGKQYAEIAKSGDIRTTSVVVTRRQGNRNFSMHMVDIKVHPVYSKKG